MNRYIAKIDESFTFMPHHHYIDVVAVIVVACSVKSPSSTGQILVIIIILIHDYHRPRWSKLKRCTKCEPILSAFQSNNQTIHAQSKSNRSGVEPLLILSLLFSIELLLKLDVHFGHMHVVIDERPRKNGQRYVNAFDSFFPLFKSIEQQQQSNMLLLWSSLQIIILVYTTIMPRVHRIEQLMSWPRRPLSNILYNNMWNSALLSQAIK